MSRSVESRRTRIVELVTARGRMSVQQLADAIEVSAVTIRRDLDHLAVQGQIRRAHGQAVSVTEGDAEGSGDGDAPRTIALVVPTSVYYYERIIVGAQLASRARGAKLILAVSDYEPETERVQVERLIAKGIDGLIIAPTPDFTTGRLSAEQENWLSSLSVPVVVIERDLDVAGPASGIDTVGSALAAGSALAIRHLVELGHQSIASLVIIGPNSARVRDGVRAGVSRAGATLVREILAAPPAVEKIRAELLKSIRDGVTALFVHNDQLATSVLLWLEEAGIEVPRDVSLVCFDDVIADMADVALTALAPPKQAVGERAVQRVLALGPQDRPSIGGDRIAERLELVPQLVVRQSTAPRTP